MSRGAGPIITDLFVYGTLKRGECRESMWPRKPIEIREAFMLARLYDVGPYPAIRVDVEGWGNGEWGMGIGEEELDDELDWVCGEVWSFDREDILVTIARLDEIEDTNQPGIPNLYDHVLVRAHDRPGSPTSQLALAYQYSNEKRLAHSARLRPRDGEDYVSWTAVR